MLAGPIAGVVLDRLDRKKVMIASDLIRCVVALGFILTVGGAPKRAKMRVRVNSVNCVRRVSFDVLGTVVLIFQSRFFFVRRKINFSFFLVDLGADF